MSWRFETDCVGSDGPSITAMVDAATTVSYRMMLGVIGQAFTDAQRRLGYDTGSARGGLRMSQDWAVSYCKSTYRGKPCYYFRWSAIEHIFLEDNHA